MNKRILAAAVCGTLFAGASAETANTITEPVTNAARIVVTATRSTSTVRRVPGNPTVITAKDLADGHYTSVPEALQKRAGVFFRNYADNPSQASVDMRGFGDNSHGRVLVLVDGRRQNEADMATLNWSAIPLSSIERIEVLSGPATALYGDNAVGGVINIITAKGSDAPSVTLGASAGSNKAFEQNASASGQSGNLGYTVTANHQSGEGYRDRSRYDNLSFSTGLRFFPNEFFSGQAGFSVIDRQYQLPGALSAAQARANRKQSVESSDIDDTQYNVLLGGIFSPDDQNTFAMDLGYRRLNQSANMNREWGPWATYSDIRKDTWTVEPRYTLALPIGNANNEITLGMDWRYESIRIDRFTTEARTAEASDADITQQTTDFYLNNRFFLMDEKLILNAGARAGQSRISARDLDITGGGGLIYDESRTRHENAYSVGLTALPTKKTKLYVKYDEFYRFPFTDEQAIYTGSVWSDSFSNLQPERGQNMELGGSWSPAEKNDISLTIYRMQMQNEIKFNPSTFVNENLPDTLHQGIELAAHSQPSDLLRFGIIYNYTDAKFAAGPNDGNSIPWVPRDHLRATIDITPIDSLTVTAGATYTGRMHAINDNGNNGKPQGGYTLFDLLANYSVTAKQLEWNFFAGIDNLFDKKYDLFQVSNAAGTTINHYPAPERTFKAGLRVKF